MFETRNLVLLLGVSLLVLSTSANATVTDKNGDDRDPGKRSSIELQQAETAFDNARAAYDGGRTDKGDAALEEMTKALDACLKSLGTAHKARLYKKAELKVALLQRRMSGLLDDIGIEQRGWAEQTNRKLDEIHDKLIMGAMSK